MRSVAPTLESMNTGVDEAVRIRYATADELSDVYRLETRAFGVAADARDIEAWKRRVEPDDILVAEDVSEPGHPHLIGTSLCYRLQLTVPGGERLSAAWLGMVAVSAPYQARGIWQRLSAEGFQILQDRGYPILCGVPTDPKVYQVLGAGLGSYTRTYAIDPRSTELLIDPDHRRSREIDIAEARSQLPHLYDRWCALTPGALRRGDAWWVDHLEDRPTQRDHGSPLNVVVHPDGFLTYRVVGAAPHAFQPPFGRVVVNDFCPITHEAHTDLLATLLSMKMFDSIELEVPVDDPLPLKLVDPRAVRTERLTDFLWLRIMDIPEVLGARRYGADVDIVMDVRDPLHVAGGRFLLQTRGGAGKCIPGGTAGDDDAVDIELALGDLATVYLGAHRVSELHRAGRVNAINPGVLDALDAAFDTERAPYCGTIF